MAIAFDAFSVGSVNPDTTLTVSHTITGSNPALVVGVLGGDFGEGDTITGVTWNGVAMTQVQKAIHSTHGAGDRWVYLYLLQGADTGTHNVVVSSSSSHYMSAHIASYTGAAQSGGADSSSSAESTNVQTLTTTTTVVASDSWLAGFDSNSAGGTATTAGAGTVVRTPSADAQAFLDSNGTVGTGSQSLIANNTTNARWVGVALSFAPLTTTTSTSSTTTSTTTTTTTTSTSSSTTTTSSSTTSSTSTSTTTTSSSTTTTTSSSTSTSTTTTSSSTTTTTTTSTTTTSSSTTTTTSSSTTTTTTSSSTTTTTTTSTSTTSTTTTLPDEFPIKATRVEGIYPQQGQRAY